MIWDNGEGAWERTCSHPLSYLSLLLCATEHQNTRHTVFPHHPPEVIHCGLHGTLCQDVLVSALVALCVCVCVCVSVCVCVCE